MRYGEDGRLFTCKPVGITPSYPDMRTIRFSKGGGAITTLHSSVRHILLRDRFVQASLQGCIE